MCGADKPLLIARIEDTELKVCMACARHGRVISRSLPAKNIKVIERPKAPEKEMVFTLVEDYAEQIKTKREKLGLKQEELAKKLSEKESLLHNIESGHFKPSVEVAKKFERFLGLHLVEQVEVEPVSVSKTKPDELTIGDFVKIKKR
jgi:putative transcription factor